MMKALTFAAVLASLGFSAEAGTTFTWIADGDGAFDGEWSDARHWRAEDGSTGLVPGEDDAAEIPSDATTAYTVVATCAVKVASLTVGSASGATATFEARTIETNRVSGDVIVNAKGKMTHAENGESDRYHLNFEVGGDLTVNGTCDVSAKGFAAAKGPGSTGGHYASHGGCGYSLATSTCYGSIRAPTTLGSGGDAAGGGAIYFDVAGTCAANVAAAFVASGGASGTGGAGGSIFIKAGAFALKKDTAGLFQATMGTSSTGCGGGRIALYQRGSDAWTNWADKMAQLYALSGNAGGPGTLYRETTGQGGCGDLLVPGNTGDGSGPASNNKACVISTNVDGWQEPFNSLCVGGSGCPYSIRLVVGNGVTLKIMRKLSVMASASCRTRMECASANIELCPPAGETCTVSGLGSFVEGKTTYDFDAKTFSCTNSPGATIVFATGNNFMLKTGKLYLRGTEERPLNLVSATTGTQWKINIVRAQDEECIQHVTVRDSNSTGQTLEAWDSQNGGNNSGWSFKKHVRPGARLVWTGEENDDWGNGANWDDDRAPIGTDVLCIPNGCARYPRLTDASVESTFNQLIVEDAASLTLAGVSPIVTNVLSLAGTLAAGVHTLTYSPESGPAVVFGGACSGILADGTVAGTVTFTNGFTAETFACAVTEAKTLRFAAGKTATITGVLTLNGLRDGQHLLTLASTAAGSRWFLKVVSGYGVRGVRVSDSDASSGKVLMVGGTGTDEGRNESWNFDLDALYSWKGATSSDWNEPANWEPNGTPKATSVVTVAPTEGSATVLATGAVTVAQLEIGGAGGTVNFTARAPLTVGGRLLVGNGATVALDSADEPNEVSGDVEIQSGGTLTHTENPSTVRSPTDRPKYRLNLAVGGDLTLASGGAISADGKGFATGCGSSPGNAPSHGGCGRDRPASECYGSIFEPVTLGSGGTTQNGYGGAGGGVIRLAVAGTFTHNGTLSANGRGTGTGESGYGAGGSILVKAAAIVGTGSTTAYGAKSSASFAPGSGGGRIALYQREAADWSRYTGLVTAEACNPGGAHQGKARASAGTVYRQVRGDAEHGGLIELGGSYWTESGTLYDMAFPMPDDGRPATAYRQAVVHVKEGRLQIGGNVKVRDLDLMSRYTTVVLNDHLIRVAEKTHENCNWTAKSAVVDRGQRGDIIWMSPGFLLFVK